MKPPLLFIPCSDAGSADASVNLFYVLHSPQLDYYFSDRGYSIVQKDAKGKAENRTDVFFRNGKRIIPEGESVSPVKLNTCSAGRSKKETAFTQLRYRNFSGASDLVFRIDGDSLEKTITHPGFYSFASSFEVDGAVLLSDSSCNDFHSAAGDIREKMAAGCSPVPVNQQRRLPHGWMLTTNARAVAPLQFFSQSLSWMTYIGGTDSDELFGIDLTRDDGVVVCGRTGGTDFPSLPGAMQDTSAGSYDAVILRFDADGNCLWSTYYGGTGFDGAYALVTLDSCFAICGMTNSTDLPVSGGPQLSNAGSYDGFILLLDDSGQAVKSTYIGGTGADQVFSIAKGRGDTLVIAGSTSSANFPYTSGQFQPACAGLLDAFICVMTDSLVPQWATYYGGSSSEDIHHIIVSPQDEIIFCGGTYSNNFPLTPNAWQGGVISTPDVYLVKFGMDGARHYATCIGGSAGEDANMLAADSAGNFYVTGFTYSFDFPIQGNSFQSMISAQNDAYVAKFDPQGQLSWSTFIGGNGVDIGLCMQRRGEYLYVAGQTESTDFPLSGNSMQVNYGGNGDGFVVKLDTAGNMVAGTYVGGNGVDAVYGISVTSDTNVFCTGDTYSTDLPVTPGAFQSVNNGQGEGFLCRFKMSDQLFSTGTAGDRATEAVSVYPNPSSGLVQVTSSSVITQVTVTDAEGRIVSSQKNNSETVSLDISGFAPGIYWLNIWGENGAHSVVRVVKY
ncbi:MAG TPA: T9SS type A sorting domain-containing protein [Bacteroidia bacterium]|nr:T9SS type A sorting domain-containing protein [Bacteroidia bacterium]